MQLTQAEFAFNFIPEFDNSYSIIFQPLNTSPDKCYNILAMVNLLNILALIFSILGLGLGAYCFLQTRSINKLRETFFAGKTGEDLEGVILSLQEQLYQASQHQALLEHEQKAIRHTLGFAVQKVGMVRFNPFAGSGGNFSFSLALLDEQNNGAVVTSMYGREQNRIYAKKITVGHSDSQLTDEETEAVKLAHAQYLENHQIENKKVKEH